MYEVKAETPATQSEKVGSSLKKLFDLLFSILQYSVMAGAVLVILYLIFISPHQVDGRSMYPTYENGEYVISSKVAYDLGEVQRGDVIVFKFSDTRDFIKRIIALPGDSVQISNGKYLVNGEFINENDYLSERVITKEGAFLKEDQILIVPDGKVFVSGDNRPFSSDSRAFGPVEIDRIKGKVFLVIYPLTSIRLAK